MEEERKDIVRERANDVKRKRSSLGVLRLRCFGSSAEAGGNGWTLQYKFEEVISRDNDNRYGQNLGQLQFTRNKVLLFDCI